MDIPLGPDARRFIKHRVKKYGSPEGVVQAGLAALDQQEQFGDFAAGEMVEILKDGERSIQRGGVVDAAEVFAELKSRARRRGARKAG